MCLQGDELIFGDPIYVSRDDMLLLDWIGEASDSEYGSLNTLNKWFIAIDVPSEISIDVSNRILEKLGTPQLAQIQLRFILL
ncbi:hypothetical protein DPMN_133403 [Dreissena polymorpha]|uniref:Uncharacterized protein n=1 Tax=Dreissena polymorpha TaxID=45954 RepID=A0A9D4FXV3_DREPO|nr:hypothetical protein DPMN_133403 [Dreissena polymorpha]